MRFLFTLFFAISIAVLFFIVLQIPGMLTLEVYTYKIETSIAFLLTFVLCLLLIAFLSGQIWTFISAAPSWWKNKKRWSTQEKAISHFVEAMELLHLGEKEKAEKKAKYLLGKQSQLSGLLWSQIGAESPVAYKAISQLSTAQTGQVLSLITLAKKAEKEAQWQTMKALAEQAYALKPNAPEVVYMLFKASLKTAHFKEALSLENKLKLTGYYGSEEFDKIIASLYLVEAQNQTDKKLQQKALDLALLKDETFIPAMVYDIEAKEKKAFMWAVKCPHPRVLDIWHDSLDRLSEKQLLKKQEALLKRIQTTHPNYVCFAKGYLFYLADKLDEAYMYLKKSVKDLPYADVYKLLAKVEKERHITGTGHQTKWLSAALDLKNTDVFIGSESLAFWENFKKQYPVTEKERPSRLEQHIHDQ